jgi:hypothetical protein
MLFEAARWHLRKIVPRAIAFRQKPLVELLNIDVLEKALVILARNSGHQTVAKINAEHLQAARDGAGPAPVHAENDNYLLLAHVILLPVPSGISEDPAF